MISTKERNTLRNMSQCRAAPDSSGWAFLSQKPVEFFDELTRMLEQAEFTQPDHICGALRLLALLRCKERWSVFMNTIAAFTASENIDIRSYCVAVLVMLHCQANSLAASDSSMERARIVTLVQQGLRDGVSKDVKQLALKYVIDQTNPSG